MCVCVVKVQYKTQISSKPSSMFTTQQHSLTSPGAPDPLARILAGRKAVESERLVMSRIQWTDNDRNQGSTMGRNNTDMRLRLKSTGQLLPAVRYQNFADNVYSLSAADFKMVVGNEEAAGELRNVSLQDFLQGFGAYAGLGRTLSLYDPNSDQKVIIRVQCFPLPADPDGACEFVPSAYNYQTSSAEDPKNAIFVASHLGTSVKLDEVGAKEIFLRQIVDGKSVDTYFKAGQDTPGASKQEIGSQAVGAVKNVVIFGQIPLRQPEPEPEPEPKPPPMSNVSSYWTASSYGECNFNLDEDCYPDVTRSVDISLPFSTLEEAPITYGTAHGEAKGFNPVAARKLERDTSQPVALTICYYYMVGGNGLTSADVRKMKSTITACYADGGWRGPVADSREL